MILNFCKDARNIFIKSSPSEKRTICEVIGSNFIANGQKIDISLYPIFYDIIEMNRLSHSENIRFELTETQAGTKKEPSRKAPNLNGGINAHRFELFKKFYEHLNDNIVTRKICYLISSLDIAA